MKKILIPILLMTGSIIKATTASAGDIDLGATSNIVIVLLRAGGLRSNRINAWVDALKKSNAEAGIAIKTYMASQRNPPSLMAGADAIEIRKAVENNTQSIDGDMVMGTFVMEGNEDSVTVQSDIYNVEVIAPDQEQWEIRTDVPESHGEYTGADSCTRCTYKWKAVADYEKSRLILHTKASCESNFPKEVFFEAISQ
jgi:hypothetical protein